MENVHHLKRESVSVVFSFRNEEEVIPELVRRLHAALKPTGVGYEFIFVNDDSTDRSVEVLTDLRKTDSAIKIINMSTRFGVNPCFIAGMRYATGDAIITLDTDLQDPPEILPEMIEKWRAGADVVNMTRTAREGESSIKLFITGTAYRILGKMCDIDLPIDTGMFKLISRPVVDTLTSFNEVDPFLRGLITWAGYKQTSIQYKRGGRFAGETHFPLLTKEPWLVFVRGLLSFSRVPLAAIVGLGGIITVLSVLAILSIPIASLFGASTAYLGYAFLTFIGGAQLFATGIVGLYLSRTYAQVRQRPEYVVASTAGFEEAAAAPSFEPEVIAHTLSSPH